VIAKSADQFTQFRLQLYQYFNKRKDNLMDLVDAVCSGQPVHSVAEYSLNPLFHRSYSSLYKGIQDHQPQEQSLFPLAAPYLSQPRNRPYYLMSLDVTPCPRNQAFKLQERECVYQPNPIKGSPQIAYGHQYSELGLLPERDKAHSPHWVNPLDTARTHRDDQEQTGIKQVRAALEADYLPFAREFCVLVADCKYSTPTFLYSLRDKDNLGIIVRARSNRTVYAPAKEVKINRRGHPVWYEKEKFSLNDPSSWPAPDQALSLLTTNSRGKANRVEIMAWRNKVMRGSWKSANLPMHQHPFTLVKIELYDEQNQPVFKKPLWLIVFGLQREKLGLTDIHSAYRQRSDMEHFFRFMKRQMRLDGYQTCETAHEESWWQLVHLAYLQLWVAKEHACCLPYPWQRYLPQVKEKQLSPTMVQRSFSGIIRQFGTPARLPQPRGNSPGRPKRLVRVPRKDQPMLHRCRN
jgi:hypothetical protein